MKISSRRRSTMLGLGVLAAGALALPSQVGAGPPIPATSASLTLNTTTCTVGATYSWQNFKRARTMVLEITDTSRNVTDEFRDPVASGAKTGSTSHSIAGLGGNFYSARGHLENRKRDEIAGSDRGTGAAQQLSGTLCL